MANVAITLEYGKQQVVDLGLPLDVTCRSLIISLAQALHLDTDVGETLILYEKTGTADRFLSGNATLGELEIFHGSRLSLVPEKSKLARPIPQGGAVLLVNDNEIPIKGGYLLIGRRDPKRGFFPDLDLSELDTSKICSRKHAAIEFTNGSFSVKDLGSSNGTWINGHRIPPENAQPVVDGDEITFGKNGAKVIFRRLDN